MRRYVNRFSVIFSGYCMADRATVHLKDIFNIFQYHRLHILVDFSKLYFSGGCYAIYGLIKSDSCRHVLLGCCFGSVCCVGLGVFNIIFCTEIPETSWIYPHVTMFLCFIKALHFGDRLGSIHLLPSHAVREEKTPCHTLRGIGDGQ